MNHTGSSLVVTYTLEPQPLAEPPHRDGATFDQALDGARLHYQHNRVLAVMKDGAWHTLPELAAATGDPEASISARIRDLRKARFGGYVVDRRRRTVGLNEYRLQVGQLELDA